MEGLAEESFRLVLLTPYLTALAVMDIRTRKLPNAWTLGGLAAGVVCQAGLYGLAGVVDALAGAGLCVLFLLVPYLIRAAGAGDLKLLAACGAFVGMRSVPMLLVLVSFAGFLLAVAFLVTRHARFLRMKHLFRSLFDWRYDRKAGAAALPPVENESGRVPFGIAIAVGAVLTLAAEVVGKAIR